MLRSSRLKTCRGTELLDELATILPNLYNFNKDNDLEFASTILLLNRYWDNLKERTRLTTQNCEANLFASYTRWQFCTVR